MDQYVFDDSMVLITFFENKIQKYLLKSFISQALLIGECILLSLIFEIKFASFSVVVITLGAVH